METNMATQTVEEKEENMEMTKMMESVVYYMEDDNKKQKMTSSTPQHPIDHHGNRNRFRNDMKVKLDEIYVAQVKKYLAHPDYHHISKYSQYSTFSFYKTDQTSPTGVLSYGSVPITSAVEAAISERTQICQSGRMGNR